MENNNTNQTEAPSRSESTRRVVIPGEVLATGDDFLPGENTAKRNSDIVALKFGLAETQNQLIKVIALSGVYQPRRGNVVVGEINGIISGKGWLVDIGYSENGFLSIMDISRYVDKNALDEVMGVGDMLVAKIWNIGGRGIDLSAKMHGFGKVEQGIIVKVNPNKVPRIIGKEGSMVHIIKDNTGCSITVGQNGVISIRGERIEDELFAKKAVLFVAKNSFVSGLTDQIQTWFKDEAAASGYSRSPKAREKVISNKSEVGNRDSASEIRKSPNEIKNSEAKKTAEARI